MIRILNAMKRYTTRLQENKDVFLEKVSYNESAPEDPQALRQYEVAAADRRMMDTFAKSDFKNKIADVLAAMHRKNHNRTFEAPSDDMMRILQTLALIDNPEDEVLRCAAHSLKGNALALHALNSLAKSSKSKMHADVFVPMPEEATEKALEALKTYLDALADMPADEYLATAKEYDTNKPEAFVDEVLHVPAAAFLAAVMV